MHRCPVRTVWYAPHRAMTESIVSIQSQVLLEMSRFSIFSWKPIKPIKYWIFFLQYSLIFRMQWILPKLWIEQQKLVLVLLLFFLHSFVNASFIAGWMLEKKNLFSATRQLNLMFLQSLYKIRILETFSSGISADSTENRRLRWWYEVNGISTPKRRNVLWWLFIVILNRFRIFIDSSCIWMDSSVRCYAQVSQTIERIVRKANLLLAHCKFVLLTERKAPDLSKTKSNLQHQRKRYNLKLSNAIGSNLSHISCGYNT